jgi:diguanylate cyclase (GGDEF)-like protein
MDDCEETIRQNTVIIERFFLGDVSRVAAMETEFNEWTQIRKEILRHVAAGDMVRAEVLVKKVGTPKFNQITPHLDYILEFARNKGRYFSEEAERQATDIQRQVAAIAFALGCLLAASSYVVIWRVRNLHSELDQLATVDFLTGLPNRRRFMEQAESEMARSARYKQPFAMAVLDIDFFKKVNDQYGHSAGDAVLKTFGAVCRETLRDSDFVGRIGGEEFAVLFPNTALPEAIKVLERLRSRIAETAVAIADNQTINITASFGVAIVSDHGDEIAPLFQLADQALYEAKESGRNRVCARSS